MGSSPSAEMIGSQIAGAVVNAQLFKELQETETSLRESETRFRAIFEQAAVGVAEMDIATGRFLTSERRQPQNPPAFLGIVYSFTKYSLMCNLY